VFAIRGTGKDTRIIRRDMTFGHKVAKAHQLAHNEFARLLELIKEKAPFGFGSAWSLRKSDTVVLAMLREDSRDVKRYVNTEARFAAQMGVSLD
jgi:hypothetical protein